MTSNWTPPMPPAEVIPTSSGDVLHASGFLYHLKAANASENYYEWECKQSGTCPSTVFSSGGGRNAIVQLGHNHKADLDEMEALRLVHRIEGMVRDGGPTLPVNKILKIELSRCSPGVRSKLENLLNKSTTSGHGSCKKSRRKRGRKIFKQSDKFYRTFLCNFMKDPTFNWYSIDKALRPLYKGKFVRYGAFLDVLENRKRVEEDIGRLTDDPNALIVSLEEGQHIQEKDHLLDPSNCVSVEMQSKMNESVEITSEANINEKDDIEIIIPPCPAAKPIHSVRQKIVEKKCMLIDLTDDSD